MIRRLCHRPYHAQALQIGRVADRPAYLARARVRVHTRTRVRVLDGRLDTSSIHAGLAWYGLWYDLNRGWTHMAKQMREQMPKVTEFVDACREVFGVALINRMIRSATKDGEPTFYAEEGGVCLGVEAPTAYFIVNPDALIQEPMTKKGKR